MNWVQIQKLFTSEAVIRGYPHTQTQQGRGKYFSNIFFHKE
jgi:hypothetical protein